MALALAGRITHCFPSVCLSVLLGFELEKAIKVQI